MSRLCSQMAWAQYLHTTVLQGCVSPRGHVTISGDVLGCLDWGGGCYWHLVGQGQDETPHSAQGVRNDLASCQQC